MGINDDNQRALFDAAKQIGVCKLYTSYANTTRGSVKPNGVLSFIRREELSEQEFNGLKERLEKLGITIEKYIAEKDLKCSIKVTDFYRGKLDQSDDQIVKDAELEI